MDSALVLPPSSHEAADLLRRARRGESAARDELARRYRRQAYLFALQLLGNREDAMDIAQDAMIRFFTTLERFEIGREVGPWLFTIVRNRVRDLWRRRAARRFDDTHGCADLAQMLVDPGPTPEQLAHQQERRRQLWRALSRLPVTKREILVLRDYHDLTYAELAQVLQIPLGTVMSRLHAARRELRRLYEHGTESARGIHDG